jgi:hypothetical protein
LNVGGAAKRFDASAWGNAIAKSNAETPPCKIGSAANKREAVTKRVPQTLKKDGWYPHTWKR